MGALLQGNSFKKSLFCKSGKKFFALIVSCLLCFAAFSEDAAVPESAQNPPISEEELKKVLSELGLDDPILDSPEEEVVDVEPGRPELFVVADENELDDLHENEREILEHMEPKVVTEIPYVPEKEAEPDEGIKKIDVGLNGLDNELTQKYITYFQTLEGKKYLIKCLENSVPYRPYIIQKIKENNLPLYLQYLPIVESNYVITARSRSGATGMWQFMENSMAPLLKKSKWHDDRRDPWKSTDAAILKLKLNYSMFNDWELAIVAYNCGAGALQRIMKENPGLGYWELSANGLFKGEALHYIPKLLAVADVVENADYYGMPEIKDAAALIEGKEVEDFDYLNTKAMLTFSQLSQASGVSVSKIKELNPALLSDCTPLAASYDLRLPKGKSVGVADKLKKKGLALDSTVHKVEKGENLWKISRKYGVTVDDLCRANGIKESSILSIGTKLVIPIYK
ncbi:MAG: transglycosylase SLT domain-containing protein [Treponema sp.]|nr:transglycosylase SLT domain-containing protein [Treponema sp.]